MTSRNLLILFLILLLGGCATGKTVVWIEKEVSLKGYNSIEVHPAVNKTGKIFEYDIADVVTEHIKSILKTKGYETKYVEKNGHNVLIMQTDIIAYEPGSTLKRWISSGQGWGKTHCTVRSFLLDKKTGQTIGEIVAVQEISKGGSVGADKQILEIIAEDIVGEIEKLTKKNE